MTQRINTFCASFVSLVLEKNRIEKNMIAKNGCEKMRQEITEKQMQNGGLAWRI